MTYDLTTLKNKQRLEDVAARYVHLRRSGTRLIGLCPLHEEHTPSFTIDPRRQQFRCFGCQAHGDVIDLVRHLEHLDFKSAVARLGGEPAPRPIEHAERLSSRRSACSGQEAPQVVNPAALQALTIALEWWQDVLWRTPHALAYLEARGLDRTTIGHEGIGYSDGRVLLPLRWLRGCLDAAYELGIIDRYGNDRFAGRIIVPEVRGGRPIWLTGRVLETHTDVQGRNPRKYLALTGVERPLLGYEAACAATAPPGGGVLVCEGPFDRFAALGWGYTAVAMGGAWASTRAMRELRILLVDKKGGYVVPDRDRTGHHGMLTMLGKLDLPRVSMPGVVRLPVKTKDLGELATHPQGAAILGGRLAAASRAREKQAHSCAVRSQSPGEAIQRSRAQVTDDDDSHA